MADLGHVFGTKEFIPDQAGAVKQEHLDPALNLEVADSFATADRSHQTFAADLELDSAAGGAADNPKFLAPFMGNLLGDTLTKAGAYLAGVIGALSVTGAKSSTWPVAGLLGIIMDGVTEADGAVVAHIDGDSAITRVHAMFKAMMRNSTPGSGADYGLDLFDDGGDDYPTLPYAKADVRLSNEILILSGSDVPVDYTDGDPAATGEGFAGPGSIYLRTATGKMYLNGGTKAQPLWKIVTSA